MANTQQLSEEFVRQLIADETAALDEVKRKMKNLETLMQTYKKKIETLKPEISYHEQNIAELKRMGH